jgi:hypothetical protein
MLPPIEKLVPENSDWQQLCKTLKTSVLLTAVVLVAWQMGLWIAKAIIEQQLTERAQETMQWGCCSVCGSHLVSKGFVSRRIQTLVGWVEWKRRVGRCPHHCSNSHYASFDQVLEIDAHQQTSTELRRLGCLLAVFLPFELAAMLLQQFTGISIADATIWNWVQVVGQKAKTQLEMQLQDFQNEKLVESETLDRIPTTMPLIIGVCRVSRW